MRSLIVTYKKTWVGSFEQVQKCPDALIIELDNYAFRWYYRRKVKTQNKNKVQLSAFMNATYKKRSRGERCVKTENRMESPKVTLNAIIQLLWRRWRICRDGRNRCVKVG